MNDWLTLAAIVTSLGWLILSFRAYNGRGNGPRTTAIHAGLWVLIIATVAVVAGMLS